MIEIKNVYKSYEKVVLENFNLKVDFGDRIAVIGSSGEGKTTLMRVITGLEEIDSGEVIGDVKMSTVFQEDRLIENLSAVDNVLLVLEDVDRSFVESELLELGITDWKQRVSEMSGGMKRRVAIARAMLYDSRLVILDEPIKGLDEENRAKTIDYINSRLNGRALLLITHDSEDIVDFKIDRVVDLNEE